MTTGVDDQIVYVLTVSHQGSEGGTVMAVCRYVQDAMAAAGYPPRELGAGELGQVPHPAWKHFDWPSGRRWRAPGRTPIDQWQIEPWVVA